MISIMTKILLKVNNKLLMFFIKLLNKIIKNKNANKINTQQILILHFNNKTNSTRQNYKKSMIIILKLFKNKMINTNV